MKSVPAIDDKDKMPEFMKEDWLASALEELESARLSPEERATLEISIAREMFERSAVELLAEQKLEEEEIKGEIKGKIKGRKENLESNIKNILAKHPEWTDEFIGDLLDTPVELVRQIRQDLFA